MDVIREIALRLKDLSNRMRFVEANAVSAKTVIKTLRYYLEAGPYVNQIYFRTPRGFHFDYNSTDEIPTGMAWAGSPFVTPSTFKVEDSMLKVKPDSVSGGRAFLYRSFSGSDHVAQWFKAYTLAGHSTTIPEAVGVRIDDGSDNNYNELVLRAGGVMAGAYNEYITRERVGGGVVNTYIRTQPFYSFPHVIRFVTEGTPWSSWTTRPILYYFSGAVWLNNIAAKTWTPTRIGMLFDANTQTATWHSLNVDAWGSDYYV